MGQQSSNAGGQKGGQPPTLTGTTPNAGTGGDQMQAMPAQQYNNANATDTSYGGWLKNVMGQGAPNYSNIGGSPWANTPNPIGGSNATSSMVAPMLQTIGGPGGAGKGGKGGQPPQPGLGQPGLQNDIINGQQSQNASAGGQNQNYPQGFDPSASYETNLAKYRQMYPNQDNPQWLQALAPQQAMWKNANPGQGDNPTGPAYDPRTPTTRAATTTPPAGGGYTPAPGQNGQVTSDYGAPGSERRKLFDAAFNTAGTGDNAGTMGDTSTEAGRTAMFGEIGSARRAAFDKAFASMNGAAPGAGGTPQQGFSDYNPGVNTPSAQSIKNNNLSTGAASTSGATYTLPKGNYRQDPSKPGNIIGPNGQSVPGFMGDPAYTGLSQTGQRMELSQRRDFLNKSYADRATYFNQLDNDRDRQDFLSNPNNKDINKQFTDNFPGGWQAYKQWVGTAYVGDPRDKSALQGKAIQTNQRPAGINDR